MTLAISHNELLRLLSYNKATGDFRWRVRRGGKAIAGSIAGSMHPSGHITLTLCGTSNIKAHRLAFFYVKGRWPRLQVDHKNRVRHDNRWANLREATRALNCQNTDRLGVDHHKGRWRARITTNGQTYYLGTFPTKARARSAYLSAKRQHHPQVTHRTML